MPIFDFACKACGQQFEAFVRKSAPVCPACKSADLDRLPSLPVAHTEGTHAKTMAQAKRQELTVAKEKEHAQRQYEASHED